MLFLLFFSIVLFGLNQEKAVATLERYLDGAQFLLKQLTCTLHHPSGSLGDNLVLGGGSEGERSPHRTDACPDLFESVDVLRSGDIHALLSVRVVYRELDGYDMAVHHNTPDKQVNTVVSLRFLQLS